MNQLTILTETIIKQLAINSIIGSLDVWKHRTQHQSIPASDPISFEVDTNSKPTQDASITVSNEDINESNLSDLDQNMDMIFHETNSFYVSSSRREELVEGDQLSVDE